MKTKKYDIFISYRRSSYDTANLIATRLKSAGYSVFFDMETLRSGKFNEQLFNVIETCTDFLLVLPPGALDRCVNEDDWVRLEVQHAMKHNKNIIPVMLNGFQWPAEMPVGMEELRYYNALTASSVEYFDLSMERMQRNYLSSKPHFLYHKYAKIAMVFIVSVVLLTGLLWGVFRYLSRDVCTIYANELVSEACAVHIVAEEYHRLEKEWDKFENAYNYGASVKLEEQKASLLEEIELSEAYVLDYWKKSGVDSVPKQIGAYHSFLLFVNGIDAKDLSYSAPFATTYLTQYMEDISTLRTAVSETYALTNRFAKTSFAINRHSVNVYYAEILNSLSEFPKSSLKTFNDVSHLWQHFPNHYEFGRDDEYYKQITEREQSQAEKLLSEYTAELNKFGADMEDFARDNNTPGAMNDIMKGLDKSLNDAFASVKEESVFAPGDNQHVKFIKSAYLGSFIPMVREWQHQLYDDGYNFRFSLTADSVYAETVRLLDAYEKEFPDSHDYVLSLKAFFKAVAKGECEYAGVLVYAFSEGFVHPELKVGDIVVEYDGIVVKTIEELAKVYKAENDAPFTVLRLTDGALKPVRVDKLEHVENTAFLNFVFDMDVPVEETTVE